MKNDTEARNNHQPENQTHAMTQHARPPQAVPRFTTISALELSKMTPEELRRLDSHRRRPVWRHHYDPYARPPVAQTVEEGLARAAKAKPGTIPEVEMLTPDELDQRREEIRRRQEADAAARNPKSGKR